MLEATNIRAKIYSYFNNLNPRVVQKSNIGSYYAYALQLMRGNTYVYRVKKALRAEFNPNKPILTLVGNAYHTRNNAAGHTQTWAYAGIQNTWFIGTKATPSGKFHWDKQIARVKIPDYRAHYHNYDFPRLSGLNHAGGVTIAESDLVRAEAAVSPKSPKLLIATVDNKDNGYFSLYDLDGVNDQLTKNGKGKATGLDTLQKQELSAFEIPGFAKTIGSIQGYDIDDDNNIYVSSELHPVNHVQQKRKIVKIPWKTTDSSQWEIVRLDKTNLNRKGKLTEFEGIQARGNNDVYLTVSYHPSSGGTDSAHRIYEVKWD